MPVECYSWQVHPSWIGRGWQTILGSVPGEACETEDPCQWSVTPGRSTKTRLVEGDRPYWGQSLVKPVCLKTYASRVFSLAGPTLSWIGRGWQAILGSVPGETCVSEDLRHYSRQVHPSWIGRGWQVILGSIPGEPVCLKTYASGVLLRAGPPKLDWSRVTGHTGVNPWWACVSEDLCQWSVTPGRSTKAGLVEGDRSYWGQSLVKPVCLKNYASGVLSLAGPPKLDWSRVTGHTGASPWWSLCVWRPMPVECYSWQVHPSWIGRGWQTILGSVPGEACETEDPCQWSVTPGRSTKTRLVEGDRPYWGQSLVKPVCLKTYASGVLSLGGPPKLDWSRVTGQTGDSRWPSRLRV